MLTTGYKIGIGYDIHRLVEGRKLFLGGVEIPYVKGLLGHSDADALLHAICDALLGAIGESDIGECFPDTDERYQGVSSCKLLECVLEKVKNKNFVIQNIDAVIIAEQPAIVPFKKKMREKISGCLGIPVECVNVKGKTNEGMGEVGKAEAIACYAVALVKGEGA